MTGISRAGEVLAELAGHGHDLRELERAGLAIQTWTPVPRLSVRMPELVCIQCGLRVETRGGAEPCSLPHGSEQSRAWSFGLVDSDLIAFGAGRYAWTRDLRAVRFERRSGMACWVEPAAAEIEDCPGALPTGRIESLLGSRERTMRFTGIKLARLTRDQAWRERIAAIGQDAEEDIYTRLEAAAYLGSAGGEDTAELFEPFLADPDEQIRLEAVIAVAEAGDEAGEILASLRDNQGGPQWVREAAAWAFDLWRHDRGV